MNSPAADSSENPSESRAATSPEATGGAGTIAEYRLGAVALVALLVGDRLNGLHVPVTRVEFQQGIAGRNLDDIVIHGESPTGDDLVVDYQSKRNLAPTAGNSEFQKVITASVRTLRSDPEGVTTRRHRVGIAAAGPLVQLAELRRVTAVASANHSPEGFRAVLVPGTTDRDVCDRCEHLRRAVSAALQEIDGNTPTDAEIDLMTWRLASALEIWVVEVEGDGRDARDAINRLGEHTGDRVGAESLFESLVSLAELWGPSAGTINNALLRMELERRGVALPSSHIGAAAFRRSQASTEGILSNLNARIAGSLHLPRQALRDRITSCALEHPITLVTGKAGAGKSALACLAAADLRSSGNVVIVVALAHGMTVSDLDDDLGATISDALAGAPTGRTRVLVVDGAEQALSDACRLLGHVVDAMPHPEREPGWNLVVTARDEAAYAVESLLTRRLGRAPQIVAVGDLSDDEVDEVLSAFPHLAGIARHPRPAQLLLRRPYLVSLLAGHASGASVERLIGEEDVVDLVMNHIIRRDGGAVQGRGTPDARSEVFLKLADAQIAGQLPSRIDGTDGEAKEGLRIDGIIALDRMSYRFAHDVLADYAVAARLLEPGGAGLLLTSVEPRRLLRGARLWMQHRLASVLGDSAKVTHCFEQLLDIAGQVGAADGPRWHDLPYEALLHAGSSPSLVTALEEKLLADDGHHLAALLDVTSRLGRQFQ